MATLLDRLPHRRDAVRRDATVMGSALIGMGTLHFVVPGPFDSIVPQEIPGNPRTLTYASGVAEAAIGVGLLVPRTRKRAALAAVALYVAVFPANINSVRVLWKKPLLRYGAIARLPLQVPMITRALKIYRATP